MTPWNLAAFACVALALLTIATGLYFTAELIKEYGGNVSRLRLTAQAAILWGPPFAALTWLAYLCRRRARTRD